MSSKYSSSMDKIYGSFKTDTSSSSNETSSSIIHAALNELSKSQKKKQIRDPFAHRRVEKTRRDRMNVSLSRLGSLIPESFHKKGNARVDKIKTLDLAIAYLEHLSKTVDLIKEPTPGDVSSSSNAQTTRSAPVNETSRVSDAYAKNEDLWYMKGFFNGSLELVSFILERCIVSKSIDDSTPLASTDPISIDSLIDSFRSFHRTFFKAYRLNDAETEFVIKPYKQKRFPANNRRMLKKVLSTLGNDNKLDGVFYDSLSRACHSSSQSRYSSDTSTTGSSGSNSDTETNTTSQSARGGGGSSSELNSSRRISHSIKSDYSSTTLEDERQQQKNHHRVHYNSQSEFYTDDNSSNYESFIKKRGLNESPANVPSMSQRESSRPKKLKTNLIQRHEEETSSSFTSSNNQLVGSSSVKSDDNLVYRRELSLPLSNKAASETDFDIPDGGKVSSSDSRRNMESTSLITNTHHYQTLMAMSHHRQKLIPVFVLHSSRQFYVSGCLDPSLLEEACLSMINNIKYDASMAQTIKIDMIVGNGLVIKRKSRTSNTFSE